MSKKRKIFANPDATAIFLLLFLLIQAICSLFDFVNREFMLNSVPIKLFISFKEQLSENWAIFILFFVFVLCSDSIYCKVKRENPKGKDKNLGCFFKILLALVNILFCIDFLDVNGLIKKKESIAGHWHFFIVYLLAFVSLIVGTIIINTIIESHITKDNVHQEVVNRNKDLNKKITKIQTEKNYVVADNQDNSSQELVNSTISLATEEDNILKHPWLYNIASKKLYKSTKKEIQRKLKLIQFENNPQLITDKAVETIFVIISFLLLIGLGVLIVMGFIKGDNNTSLLTVVLDKCKNSVTSLFENLSDNLNELEIVIIGFLLSIGGLIALVVCFFIIVYSFTFTFQVWIHLKSHMSSNKQYVTKLAQKVQKFFLNSVDSVMRLLLFIPDFLETVEISILDMDELDENNPNTNNT